MTNNDILRRLRYGFEFNDHKMVAIFASTDTKVSLKQIAGWLKKDDDSEYVELADSELATFLNGLINEKRGKKEGPQPVAEKHLNNNIILTKLKIALNLKAEDIIEIMASVDFNVSKPELSAFFRKPDHKHYRQCKAQFLRRFIEAIQKKYRKSPAPKAKSGDSKKYEKKDNPVKLREARPNASKRYDNPNKATTSEKVTAKPAPKRKVLKLKPEEIWKDH